MNSSRSSHEIHGLPHVLVDGFKHRMPTIDFNERCYFLTHYHSDHYGGLASYWKHGMIYCTNTTSNLICNVIGVDAKTVRRVNIGETVTIKGAHVTFMDANHCPGAAILLFQLDGGLTHLHTGDLRYCPAMKRYPALQGVKIDRLYLDTTYAHPKHTFMAQDESIQKIVTLAKHFIAEHPSDGIIYMSAYNLGKERVIFALNDALNLPVYMDADKIHIMNQIEGGAERVQSGAFTSDPHGARIHICNMSFLGTVFPYFKPNFQNIRSHLEDLNKLAPGAGAMKHFLDSKGVQMPLILPAEEPCTHTNTSTTTSTTTTSTAIHTPFTAALAFIPTGWADMGNFNKQHSLLTEDSITVCIVPYSEHSNCNELVEFVGFLKPREVIPTVYSDEKNRLFILDLFRNCVDRVSNMRNFIARIARIAPTTHTAGTPVSASSGGMSGGATGGGGSVVKREYLGSGSVDVYSIDLCSDDEHTTHTTVPSGSSGSVKRQIGAGNAESKESNAPKRAHTHTGATTISNVCHRTCSMADVDDEVVCVSVCRTSDSSSAGTSVVHGGWTCNVCTYCHIEPGSELYLQCSLCGSPRCK